MAGDTRQRAVVSVIGRDQKGVVARISTYVAGASANIEDIEQRVMEGLFIMTMVVDLADVTLSLDELVLGLKQIGAEMQLEVSVRLHVSARASASASSSAARRTACSNCSPTT